MSEKEKISADGILSAIDKLTETRGPDYVEGLVAGIGIGIGTAAAPTPEETK